VFDIQQTQPTGAAATTSDAPPAVLTSPSQPWSSPAHLASGLAAVLTSHGWHIDTRPDDPRDDQPGGPGNVEIDLQAGTVRMPAALGDVRAVGALAATLTVAWCGDAVAWPGPDPAGLTALVGQSVTYCLLTAAGLDPGPVRYFPAVAGWARPRGVTEPDILRAVGAAVTGAFLWVEDELQHHHRPPAAAVNRRPADLHASAQTRTTAQGDHVPDELEVQSGPAQVEVPAQVGVPAQVEVNVREEVDPDRVEHLAALRRIHVEAAAFYAALLPGTWAEAELHRRVGATTDMSAWQPGYAPAGRGRTALLDHLAQRGHPMDDLVASGLISVGPDGTHRDRFVDRLMFPIMDEGGPIAFVGRHHPDLDAGGRSPKYLNSPTTGLWRKGEVLFGLAQAAPVLRDGAIAAVVEGPFDAFAVTLAAQGLAAGVATLGTALTDQHVIGLLAVAGPDRILWIGDNDSAGRKAAATACSLLIAHGADPHTVTLPEGTDPDSYRTEHGSAALRAQLEQHRPLLHAVIDQLVADFSDDLRSVEGRVALGRAAIRMIVHERPDHLVRDTAYLAAAADLLEETVHTLLLEAEAEASTRPTSTIPPGAIEPGARTQGPASPGRGDSAVRRAAAATGQAPLRRPGRSPPAAAANPTRWPRQPDLRARR
jgi:DNA primase catalytic core